MFIKDTVRGDLEEILRAAGKKKNVPRLSPPGKNAACRESLNEKRNLSSDHLADSLGRGRLFRVLHADPARNDPRRTDRSLHVGTPGGIYHRRPLFYRDDEPLLQVPEDRRRPAAAPARPDLPADQTRTGIER